MPEGTVCFTTLYTASLTSNSLTCFLIYSANSYGVANNIYIVLFGRQSTTIYLILLQSACFRAQSEAWATACTGWWLWFLFFLLYLWAEIPTAWPGLFRKELRAGGQKGCYGSRAWTVIPGNRGGGNHLLSMSGAGGMQLLLWGRWKLFGTAAVGWALGAEQELKARPAEWLVGSFYVRQVWPGHATRR